ncbi:MAG: LacI family transcriptional regulator [Hyphomicrobiales bacterium]|nr:LacI family transcriptional regulator [Hyphomicrobiales bacterium]MCP4999703.1 LacI family transcriptional regulator [Hyphomicrobiales bacterium]
MTSVKRPGSGVTSFDVARLAGVSRSAVSRAFTPRASISKDARLKVFDAASQLGYRVNPVARALNQRRTDLVGMIVARMDNPFRASQIDALSRTLVRHGFRPMLFCIDEGLGTEQLLSLLLDYSVSGVVITSDAPPIEICNECARQQIPLVLVDRDDRLPFVDRISGDNVKGGRIAAETLIEAGRHKLVVLSPETAVYSITTRIDAFVACADEQDVPVDVLNVGTHNYEAGRDAAASIAERRHDEIGVFCPSDIIALGLLDALRVKHGIKIPGEMSLIGYDDIPQSGWEFADMTSISQPVASFADGIVGLLTERIANPQTPPRNELLDVMLIRRGTV